MIFLYAFIEGFVFGSALVGAVALGLWLARARITIIVT